MVDELNLRRVYAEICRGYSVESWKGDILYIKHLCHFDQVDIDLYREELFSTAKNKGIKTEKERLDWLEEKNLWNKSRESDLAMQKNYIDNLEKTKNKMFLKSQIDQIATTLTEARIKLRKDSNEKEDLIGLTCERLADQKIQFYYIYLSCFKDKALQNRLFTLEDLDQLDDDESIEIMKVYINSIQRFRMFNLKKISLASYFTNYFYICGENIASFFNKPIAELSSYQVTLLSYAIYYKNLLTTNRVPDDIREDPDKLEEFINKNKNVAEALSRVKSQGGRVGMVGATKEDMESLGMRNSTEEMQNIAKKEFNNSLDAAKDGIS